jgi:hypothetical protein
MVKTEGHFKTEEEARGWMDNLAELQSERINKPNSRIRIGKRFHVKRLADGKYSVQSNKVHIKNYLKKRK